MNHPKVTVLGSANVDLVIRAERMPNKGETRIGEAFDIFTGGKGFNQATAAARLGAEVTFIGRIGDDPFADILRFRNWCRTYQTANLSKQMQKAEQVSQR